MCPKEHQITLYGKGSPPSDLPDVEKRIFYRIEGLGDVSAVESCGDDNWRIILQFESPGSFMSVLHSAASVLKEENVSPSSVQVLLRGRYHTLSHLLNEGDEISVI